MLAKLMPQLDAPAASGGPATQRTPKLERAAHEFEASLMAELLKPLEAGNDLTGESSDEDGSGSEGALAGMAANSLAQALSERGGFGIADRILHQLEAAGKTGAGGKPEPSNTALKLSASPPI